MPSPPKKPTAAQLKRKIETRANFDYSYDLAVYQLLLGAVIGILLVLWQQSLLDVGSLLLAAIVFWLIENHFQEKFKEYKKKMGIENV